MEDSPISTHGVDLLTILRLLDDRGEAPARLEIVAVEASCFEWGEEPGEAVRGALPFAVERVRGLIQVISSDLHAR